jgi:hypothetical protein
VLRRRGNWKTERKERKERKGGTQGGDSFEEWQGRVVLHSSFFSHFPGEGQIN